MLFVLNLQDGSLSMDEPMEDQQTGCAITRRIAARDAAWIYLEELKASRLANEIFFAQILFEGEAKVHLSRTLLTSVHKEQLGFDSFLNARRPTTNFYAALSASMRVIWPERTDRLPHWLVKLKDYFAALAAIAHLEPLPPVPCPTRLRIITDGEHCGLWPEEACIRQAQRMKNAGVHITAKAIGNPKHFGLLKKLVSDPAVDFSVYKTADSLQQASQREARCLVGKLSRRKSRG